jgi:tetratricopeptide (TPR) repeat protein
MSRHLVLVSLLVVAAANLVAAAKTESWLEVRTPHFFVLTNSNEKQGRHIADQFERMRAVFHKRFPKSRIDGATPIIVIAVKDKKDFQTLEPEAYLAKGQLDLAGLFLRAPDKNYMLLRLDAEGAHPYAAIYHEYSHFIMSRAEEWMPLWLNEGLAEFYQNTDIKEKEVGLGEPSAENLILLRQNRLLPLSTLFAVDYNSPYYHEENKGSIFYAESWAITHYLEIKDIQEKTHHLTDYAALVSNKKDPVEAARQAFGDLEVLQKNLDQYVSRAEFYYVKMPGPLEIDESAMQIQPITSTQADAIRADFLAYDQRVQDSRALLDRILKEDPNNVAAHETMGLLAFREGNFDEAEKWYEQAVKLDSQSFLAHYYYAIIAMHHGQSAAHAEQIESSLRAATKLNPTFAPAFDQLAVFYAMQHKNLDEAAMINLVAVQLDPENVGFRINRANLMIEMQRPTDAVAVLQGALKLAETPDSAESIKTHIDSIERYQAALANQQHEHAAALQQLHAQNESSGPNDNAAQEPAQSRPEEKNERHGPRHSLKGTLRQVQCSYPSTMNLKVESGAKSLDLTARNYFQVAYSALNFTPASDLNPCKDLEGMKAQVDYFEALDKSSQGQIISILLSK